MKLRTWIIILLPLNLIFFSCNDAQNDSGNLENSLEQYRQVLYDRSKPLENFLEKIKDHYNVPAIAAAVTNIDSIQIQAAVGVKNYNLPDKVNINDIFCIGSCAKSMTAALTAAMVENGKLNWSTRPVDIFPELEETVHPDFKNITIRQLLSHTAGIRQYVSDRDFFSVFDNIGGLDGTAIEQR